MTRKIHDGAIERHLHCRCGGAWISRPRDRMQTLDIRKFDRWKERRRSAATAQRWVQRQGRFKVDLQTAVLRAYQADEIRIGRFFSRKDEMSTRGRAPGPVVMGWGGQSRKRLTGQTTHAPRKKLVPWPEGPWV